MRLSDKFKLLVVLQDRGIYYTDLGESYLRAFNKCGINVAVFNLSPDFVNRLALRLGTNFKSIENYVLKKLNTDLVGYVEEEKPNAILIIKGTYLSSNSLRFIKQKYPNVLIFCFNPDDPFNSNKGASNKQIRESIKLYDVYLTWSKRLVAKLKHHGARDVFYLPFAADPEIIYPVKLPRNDKSNFNCDISFVGNSDEERQTWIKKISKLMHKNSYDCNFRIYGNGWKKINNIELKCKIEGLKLLKAFSGSKINLNILRLQNKHSHNMRTFEIPASSCFMLHERSEEAMDFFKEGKEAEYFSTTEELLDKSEFYLNNEDLREKISSAGYEKIFRAGYTYENRAKQLLTYC